MQVGLNSKAKGSPETALKWAFSKAGVKRRWDGFFKGTSPPPPPKESDGGLHRLKMWQKNGGQWVAYGTTGYPASLTDLPQPPVALFFKGQLKCLKGPVVAIVGTRRASAYGKAVARMLGADLGAAGVCVISGLARGIDIEAHKGSMEKGCGAAVFGCGPDHVYPMEHAHMAEKIASHGVIMSEYPPGTTVRPYQFPERNRIIAALAHITVVVEAPLRSGALITAREALDLGREVMAVPNPVTSSIGVGPNALLAQGAGVALNAGHIIDCLPMDVRPGDPPSSELTKTDPPVGLKGDALLLWRAFDRATPRLLEEVAAHQGLPFGRAFTALVELQSLGLVRKEGGGRFVQERREL